MSYDVPHDTGPMPSLQQTESWMISLKNTSNNSGVWVVLRIKINVHFDLREVNTVRLLLKRALTVEKGVIKQKQKLCFNVHGDHLKKENLIQIQWGKPAGQGWVRQHVLPLGLDTRMPKLRHFSGVKTDKISSFLGCWKFSLFKMKSIVNYHR